MPKFDDVARNKELESIYDDFERDEDEKDIEPIYSAEKNSFPVKLVIKIISIISVILGIITIGISVFTAIKCLGIGIIVMFIGLIAMWATEEFVC